jgi:hypothetical protein
LTLANPHFSLTLAGLNGGKRGREGLVFEKRRKPRCWEEGTAACFGE